MPRYRRQWCGGDALLHDGPCGDACESWKYVSRAWAEAWRRADDLYAAGHAGRVRSPGGPSAMSHSAGMSMSMTRRLRRAASAQMSFNYRGRRPAGKPGKPFSRISWSTIRIKRIFILKDEDGPLVMTSVLTEAELIAHDGTYFRDAANQRMLVHPYGDVTPSNTDDRFRCGGRERLDGRHESELSNLRRVHGHVHHRHLGADPVQQ